MSFGRLGVGVLPCDVLQPLKNIDFFATFKCLKYTILFKPCSVLQFFSFLSLHFCQKQPRELLWVSTVDISFMARLKHGMSSLDENLK